jgi:PadR family transcriptional regulator, regulatory protein PadR
VTPRSEFSPQTRSVLAALSGRPSEWHHGYAVARETGLKSGTLYPILIRLADRGLLEAEWQDEPVPGRPRRHLYRLTAAGLAAAGAMPASTVPPSTGRASTGRADRPERRPPRRSLRPVTGNP